MEFPDLNTKKKKRKATKPLREADEKFEKASKEVFGNKDPVGKLNKSK